MSYASRYKTLETNLVHAGAPEPRIGGAVVTPVFQSANYLMEGGEDTYDAVRYARLSNSPNHYTLHARLAAIEKGEAALVTSSDMAAISSTILAFVSAGDHLLAQKTLYGGAQNFLDEDSANLGFSYDAINTVTEGPSEWKKLLKPTTKMIYVETISNPLIEVGDLKAVVSFAREHNLLAVIDNTFASPVNFRPLELGFDLVVHSATKYLNGHSDIVAGCVIGGAERVGKVRHLSLHLGGSLDPHAVFLFERGLKTLALRVPRQCANAQKLAEFLESHPKVKQVNYPGLKSDPGHKTAADLFDGFGGMVSFFTGSLESARSFISAVKIPLHAASLGGVETLVGRPAEHSHLGMPPEQRDALGVSDDLIRVSVGIENIDELIEDFAQALG
ncbi:MAG: trans-sulfuration enzyme family protein [Candidatus Zixiibacteriota bacterium]